MNVNNPIPIVHTAKRYKIGATHAYKNALNFTFLDFLMNHDLVLHSTTIDEQIIDL